MTDKALTAWDRDFHAFLNNPSRTTYFVDYNIKKSGDGLTLETAFKTDEEAWDIIERNAPQNVEIDFIPGKGW